MESKNLKLIGVFMVILSIVAVLGFNLNNNNSNNPDYLVSDASNFKDNAVVVSDGSNSINNQTGKDLVNNIVNSTNDTAIKTNYENGFAVNESKDGNYNFYYNLSNGSYSNTIKINSNLINKYLKDYENNKLIWFGYNNNNFNINGITYHSLYEFLLKDTSDNKYKLVYYIDGVKFVINNLQKISYDDISKKDGYFGCLRSKVKDLVNTSSDIYIKYVGNDLENNYLRYKILSIFIIGQHKKNSMLIYNDGDRFLSLKTYSRGTGCNLGSNFELTINDINKLSSPYIAKGLPNGETRSVSLNSVQIIKSQADYTGNNGKQNFKIMSDKALKGMLEYNKQYLNSFVIDLAEKNLNFNINNKILLNDEPYTIGQNVEGLVADNYNLQQQYIKSGNVLEIENIIFRDRNYNNAHGYSNYANNIGLYDKGKFVISGTQLKSTAFGNIFGSNIDISHIKGNMYIVGESFWYKALNILYNVFTFDFSGVTQYWTQRVSQPEIKNDLTNSLGIVYYGFNTNYEYTGDLNYQINNDNGVSNIVYNNKRYYYYAVFDSKFSNYGCMVVSYHNTLLDINVPSSICGGKIAVLSGLSQYKISNGEDKGTLEVIR